MRFQQDEERYLQSNGNNKLIKICDEKASPSIPGFSLGIFRVVFEFVNC